MRFRIPFTISDIEKLKRRSRLFNLKIGQDKLKKLQRYLDNIGINIEVNEYISICFETSIFSFFIILVIASTILILTKVRMPFLYSIAIAFLFSSFVFLSQVFYPKVYDSRRIRNIEKNLIPALQDMYVQLNSGIPLFNILINISSSDYGFLSEEFKKAVKKINSGVSEVEVLEELGEKNSSNFFKRTLWQLSNGMKAGSNISTIIQESTKMLNEEQLLQIQNYGNKLNPLIMFYMVISIIIPALSIALLTIISSMINLPSTITMFLFIALFIFAVLIQIMFLGLIRSSRPSLL